MTAVTRLGLGGGSRAPYGLSDLTAETAVSTPSVDEVTIAVALTMAAEVAEGVSEIPDVSISVGGLLSPEDCDSTPSIDAYAITVVHDLAAEEAQSTGEIPSVSLSASLELSTEEALSTPSADVTVITLVHDLSSVVAESTGEVSPVNIIQAHNLISEVATSTPACNSPAWYKYSLGVVNNTSIRSNTPIKSVLSTTGKYSIRSG